MFPHYHHHFSSFSFFSSFSHIELVLRLFQFHPINVCLSVAVFVRIPLMGQVLQGYWKKSYSDELLWFPYLISFSPSLYACHQFSSSPLNIIYKISFKAQSIQRVKWSRKYGLQIYHATLIFHVSYPNYNFSHPSNIPMNF